MGMTARLGLKLQNYEAIATLQSVEMGMTARLGLKLSGLAVRAAPRPSKWG